MGPYWNTVFFIGLYFTKISLSRSVLELNMLIDVVAIGFSLVLNRSAVPLRRGTRDLRLRFLARRDGGQSAGGLVRGCPDQAVASRLAGVAGMGFQFHGSSSARRWAGCDAMRPNTSASQA